MQKLFKYGLAVVREKQLLVVREYNTANYLLPGGRPKEGESAEETLAREIKEELGVGVKRNSLKYYGAFEDAAANEPHTIIQISVYLGEITGNPTPSAEIEEVAWIRSQHNLTLAPSIRNKILPALVKDGIVS